MMSDGLKNSYYDISDCNDLDDICDKYDLSFAEGNILKSLIGVAKARKGNPRHDGTSIDRDINKIYHYANRIYNKGVKNEK